MSNGLFTLQNGFNVLTILFYHFEIRQTMSHSLNTVFQLFKSHAHLQCKASWQAPSWEKRQRKSTILLIGCLIREEDAPLGIRRAQENKKMKINRRRVAFAMTEAATNSFLGGKLQQFFFSKWAASRRFARARRSANVRPRRRSSAFLDVQQLFVFCYYSGNPSPFFPLRVKTTGNAVGKTWAGWGISPSRG